MSHFKCPLCDHAGSDRLDMGALATAVDYWRCPRCHHTWTTERATREFAGHLTHVQGVAGFGRRSGRMVDVPGRDDG